MIKVRSVLLLLILCMKPVLADGYGFPKTPAGQSWSNEIAYDLLSNYAQIAFEVYTDALDGAKELQTEVQTFAVEPSEAKFAALKQSWLKAKAIYGMTEVYRFSEGPIDSLRLEKMINGWPVDPAAIDYVEGNRDSGIINQLDTFPYVTAVEIIKKHALDGDLATPLTGWHVIEFLLWGEDLSPNSAGERPVADYISHPNAKRRLEYLKSAARLLNNHLYTVLGDWKSESYDNFLGIFLMDRPSVILKRTLRGMVVLSGEEVAERCILDVLNSGSESFEQNQFSDTAHLDILAKVEGIKMLFEGSYTNLSGEVTSGTGFYDFFRAIDEESAEIMNSELEKSLELAKSLPQPFGQIIIAPASDPRRAHYVELAESLKAFSDANRTVIEKMDL